MGILDLFQNVLKGKKNLEKRVCPNCHAKIVFDLSDKNARCSQCGTRIYSMFRKKCPKCDTANQLDAKICTKCNYLLEPESQKVVYTCPNCKYQSDHYMTSCYSCGMKFV